MKERNLHTEFVNLEQTAIGEAILTMKRGTEKKSLLIADTGLSSLVYEWVIDYYLDLGWTQDEFDDYWENGGEDTEVDTYVDMVVGQYDNDLEWGEIEPVIYTI